MGLSVRAIGVIGLIMGITVPLAVRLGVKATRAPFVPSSFSITLAPPAQAISGSLTASDGTVMQLARGQHDFTEATPAGIIRQGESLATTKGTATATFPSVGTVALGPDSELAFISLIPSSPVFQHVSGSIGYAAPNTRISVRVGPALVSATGTVHIAYADKRIVITVTEGASELAVVGQDNVTARYGIAAGTSATVDTLSRLVMLQGKPK